MSLHVPVGLPLENLTVAIYGVKGNYATSEDGFYNMVFPYMFVDSPESYAAYAQYFTGSELPYNADEIKALAELSYDDLAAACAALSVEDVVARHAK